MSDPETDAVADMVWEMVQRGEVASCSYHRDGHCSLARRPCADAIRDGKAHLGLESGQCVWAPPED